MWKNPAAVEDPTVFSSPRLFWNHGKDIIPLLSFALVGRLEKHTNI